MTLNIRRTYDYIRENKLPKKLNFFKRLRCEHDLVDNILMPKQGFVRISGEDHIVYCTKCGLIKGTYSKDY